MTVLSRGARARRGGRRPGWLLMTMLLVLAIAASSALVFTNRVELLKLAVILALWAAVAAAFVSVIYRRQSDADQAKVRDLKLVYDLQLDREISARREYELTVETHLRREIATELRAQSADEVAALRAELAALRTNLEILFDADLAHRPALESDRVSDREGARPTERAAGEWIRSSQPVRADRVVSSRVTVVRDDDNTQTAESPIIDVPEEPLVPAEPPAAPPPPAAPAAGRRRRRRRAEEDDYRGSHRRPSEEAGWMPQQSGAHPVPQPPQQSAPPPQPPPVRPEPQPPQPVQPQQQPQWQPMNTWIPGPPPPATPPPTTPPPTTPPAPAPEAPAAAPPPNGYEPISVPGPAPAPQPERRGRHSSESDAAARHYPPPPQPAWSAPSEPLPPAEPEPEPTPEPERRGRHSSGDAVTAEPQPAARHRSPEPEVPERGQSAADLLARFQVESAGGGRRRRRED